MVRLCTMCLYLLSRLESHLIFILMKSTFVKYGYFLIHIDLEILAGTTKKAKQFKALAALAENPGSVPTTHLVPNHLGLQFQETLHPLLTLAGTRHTCAVHTGKTTHTQKIKYV